MSLEFNDVTRRFGDVVALNRVSLSLDDGILALVGPNGSGKSTFMRLATGHIHPDRGEIRLFGEPVWDNPSVMARLGYVPEQDAFYERLSGKEFVAELAMLQGMPEGAARAAAEEQLAALGLGDAMHRPIKGYSKGMRQRVKLAQAMIHQPKLLLLDEPMLGCDPPVRRQIQDHIRALRDQDVGVVISSHILPEVERVTQDIAMLVGGRLIAQGNRSEVRDAISQVPSKVRIWCDEPRKAAMALADWPEVGSIRIGDKMVDVETETLRSVLQRIQSEAPAAWKLRGFEAMDADLQSLFGYLAGGAS